MRRLPLAIIAVLIFGSWLAAQSATFVQQTAARLDSAATTVTNTTSNTTSTITPVNSNDSIYVYSVTINNCSNATGGPVGAVTSLSTTGFLSNPIWTLGSGSTTAATPGGPGLCQPDIAVTYPTGLKSATPGAVVTFVVPTFATNQILRLTVAYRSAP